MKSKFSVIGRSTDPTEADMLMNGVCSGCEVAVLSDTEDLPHPGFIQPRTAGGDIKVNDMYGNTVTLTFASKEVSLFRVSRVWENVTEESSEESSTPPEYLGIVVYF